MTPELTALTLAALLQCAQFVLVSVTANLELGTKVTLSPRDGTDLFTIPCVAATRADKSGRLISLSPPIPPHVLRASRS